VIEIIALHSLIVRAQLVPAINSKRQKQPPEREVPISSPLPLSMRDNKDNDKVGQSG